MTVTSATGPVGRPPHRAGRENFRQLIMLRWIAVSGQLATILIVTLGMKVVVPVVPMVAIIGGLVALNLVSTARLARAGAIRNAEVLGGLLLDMAALTGLLYLSGGATNPFVSLFLLQVVLGAILLDTRSAWVLVAATAGCFVLLVVTYHPLVVPEYFRIGRIDLYILGALVSFVLVAVLLVFFVTRINANLRARDARLAAMRQQAAEEDHIVRMGLLASGAAHELGTPLALVSVVLNDWAKMADFADAERAEDLREMQGALARCKTILTGILTSAGEARGENPKVTTLSAFVGELADEWRAQNVGRPLLLRDQAVVQADLRIVSDAALKQVIWNVLDNARDASRKAIVLAVERDDSRLAFEILDEGPGFTPEMLANIGRPYHSTKGRPGGGLGLFLVTNVMRKLGGRVSAHNRARGGAVVRLDLPIAAIELAKEAEDVR
ncbi:ATP-binding protein [Hephaestia sp. GCM10023244]|uniref:ATP-binding protein n=1 Tax=unclassified Hephaestia TaxID=2631281 RepID=UPI0020773CEF|nr:ATP-binding protein [Hephaestia sp. MAHUQ-44]MCM8732020.1 ATP-binding protein [Hephaestia sp. MAHUQ-44]